MKGNIYSNKTKYIIAVIIIIELATIAGNFPLIFIFYNNFVLNYSFDYHFA